MVDHSAAIGSEGLLVVVVVVDFDVGYFGGADDDVDFGIDVDVAVVAVVGRTVGGRANKLGRGKSYHKKKDQRLSVWVSWRAEMRMNVAGGGRVLPGQRGHEVHR